MKCYSSWFIRSNVHHFSMYVLAFIPCNQDNDASETINFNKSLLITRCPPKVRNSRAVYRKKTRVGRELKLGISSDHKSRTNEKRSL